MEEFSLEVSARPKIGGGSSARYRKQGLLPAVVYASGKSLASALLSERAFVRLAKRATTSQVFTFKSESPELNGKLAIVKDIQLDSLSGDPLHVDFLALEADKEVSVRVPLKIVGESPGVKNDGGVLSIAMHELVVECLPAKIPSVILVDISSLELGESLHAKDIQLPEGVEFGHSSTETIVSVVASRTALALETAVAEAGAAGAGEGVAAEAGDAAAGAKKAEGAE